jgi:hypothetical protein
MSSEYRIIGTYTGPAKYSSGNDEGRRKVMSCWQTLESMEEVDEWFSDHKIWQEEVAKLAAQEKEDGFSNMYQAALYDDSRLVYTIEKREVGEWKEV